MLSSYALFAREGSIKVNYPQMHVEEKILQSILDGKMNPMLDQHKVNSDMMRRLTNKK